MVRPGRILGSSTFKTSLVWLFNVAPSGNTAYIGTSFQSDGKAGALFAFDLRTATTKTLCNFAGLDPSLNAHTGYDAWDPEGRFYFASFDGDSHTHVIITRLDIRRLEPAAGIPSKH